MCTTRHRITDHQEMSALTGGEQGLQIDHDEVLARRPKRGESQALTDNSDI
jgi:hypothetical protein